MIKPTPALVTQRAVERLPRVALLVLCVLYLVPGALGRDPWRAADVSAFGVMAALADGRTSWLAPSVAGLPPEGALLPHWLGAAAIMALSPAVDAALAARLPFVALLALTLAAVWYATFHLARTDAAQPLAFAFGGEAHVVDYARAMADAATLATMATLGLLQLGHETTPELAQLCAMSVAMWALAAAPFRAATARAAIVAALAALAASGAPAMAVAVAAAGTAICAMSAYPQVRRFAVWVAAAGVLAAALAAAAGGWAWRVRFEPTGEQGLQLLRLFAWFLWPAWVLAGWTLWQWRHHSNNRHISVPLAVAATAVVSCVVMGGSDRALLLAVPGMAVLAAFALPTMKRGLSAVVDWFSVFFFTVCALLVWVIYSAMVLGVPAKPAANVAKLAPGFVMTFSPVAAVLALGGTVAWLALVRWRTGRHRHALWKSLVLPAGGVALVWLLLMTLWLPLLDYARSYRPWLDRLAMHIRPGDCIVAPGMPRSSAAAIESLGGWRIDASADAPVDPANSDCRILLDNEPRIDGEAPQRPGWQFVARERRPTDRGESTLVYRR